MLIRKMCWCTFSACNDYAYPNTAVQSEVCDIQVLVIGKVSQAAVVAASAYKDQEAFQRQTGITKSCLIDDKLHRNTKVSHKHLATPIGRD